MHAMNAVKTTAFIPMWNRAFKSMPEAELASGRKYEVYNV